MDEERASHPYQRFTITTLRDEGVWWAKARVTAKDVGGDRPVLGGPWRTQVEAEAAAETFCDSRQAGQSLGPATLAAAASPVRRRG